VVFLCVFLEQLLLEHTKRRMKASQNGIQARDMAVLQELYEMIPDDEEVMEYLDI